MSIRIHELSKKIGIDNKELLSLLRERDYPVKAVSSTVDNITAEALVQEFAAKHKETGAPAPVIEPVVAPEAEVPTPAPATVESKQEPEAAKPTVFTTKIPVGVRVKSAADIVREKEEVVKAQQLAQPQRPPVVMHTPLRHAAPTSAPRHAAPAPVAPPAAPMVSRPTPLAPPPVTRVAPPSVPPPVSRPAPVAPAPVHPAPIAPKPVASPAPVVPPVAPAPVVPAPLSPPAPVAPVASSPAPLAPPAISRPGSMPPPPPAGGMKAPATPSIASTTSGTTPPISVTISGDIKIIHLKPPVIARDFAAALGLKPFKLISELMEMGIFASMNSSIDESVAMKVAEKHGFLLEVKHRGEAQPVVAPKPKVKQPEEDEAKFLVPRPPVVCILGHVDHGKTSLLDAIRKANVAGGEAGGITQHIGAYQIEFKGRKVTFLDTPGHAAFNKMRARGASVTDIAVLVVAADDAFMPQTDEALKHAQNAKVPIIVAANKMDVKGANLDRVKAQMQERGIAPEDWGGETITVPVSAIKGTGLEDLLDMILLQADVLELKANPKAPAEGMIIESQIDIGRGPTATVVIQRGTLSLGDAIVCGQHFAKVRAMFDDQGQAVKEAPPAMPVKVVGWSGAPDSGAIFKTAKNAREAEKIAEEEQMRVKKIANQNAAVSKDVSIENLFAEIAATSAKILRVVVKCDVFGSGEAVRHVLEGIKSNKVSLEVIGVDVGLVSKNDVLMASAAGAVIVGFNTKLENGVVAFAKHHSVRIETFGIIYELGDKVREIMADLLDPDLKEVKLGAAEVRQVFPVAKGNVAGCLVTEGKVTRNAAARVRRGKEIVAEGTVGTLRRFKDDANDVRAGLECGIRLDDFDNYKEGDSIEVYEIQKVRAAL